MERGFVPLEVGPSAVWPDVLLRQRSKEEGRVRGVSHGPLMMWLQKIENGLLQCGLTRLDQTELKWTQLQ